MYHSNAANFAGSQQGMREYDPIKHPTGGFCSKEISPPKPFTPTPGLGKSQTLPSTVPDKTVSFQPTRPVYSASDRFSACGDGGKGHGGAGLGGVVADAAVGPGAQRAQIPRSKRVESTKTIRGNCILALCGSLPENKGDYEVQMVFAKKEA